MLINIKLDKPEYNFLEDDFMVVQVDRFEFDKAYILEYGIVRNRKKYKLGFVEITGNNKIKLPIHVPTIRDFTYQDEYLIAHYIEVKQKGIKSLIDRKYIVPEIRLKYEVSEIKNETDYYNSKDSKFDDQEYIYLGNDKIHKQVVQTFINNLSGLKKFLLKLYFKLKPYLFWWLYMFLLAIFINFGFLLLIIFIFGFEGYEVFEKHDGSNAYEGGISATLLLSFIVSYGLIRFINASVAKYISSKTFRYKFKAPKEFVKALKLQSNIKLKDLIEELYLNNQIFSDKLTINIFFKLVFVHRVRKVFSKQILIPIDKISQKGIIKLDMPINDKNISVIKTILNKISQLPYNYLSFFEPYFVINIQSEKLPDIYKEIYIPLNLYKFVGRDVKTLTPYSNDGFNTWDFYEQWKKQGGYV